MPKLIARPPIIPSTYKILNPNRYDKINLFTSSKSKNYRYQLTIIDDDSNNVDNTNKQSCVVFYIPAGRESEYIFSTKKGLTQTILKSANTLRLITISFHRNENYYNNNLQLVQAELENVVQLVSYRSSKDGDNNKIPFMALDNDINKRRNVIVEGRSEGTGDYVIEEVKKDSSNDGEDGMDVIRRLYFLSNDLLIQTEVKMINNDNNKDLVQIDKYYLGFEYHKQIASGILHFLLSKHAEQNKLQGLIIGVGGGSLLTFLHNFIPALNITGIEIDEDILDIAQKYFGLPNCEDDGRLRMIIGNGLSITTSSDGSSNNEASTTDNKIVLQESYYNIIIIDVDSKDNSVGMSCPPVEFISIPYLQILKQLLSSENGMLAINICARDAELKQLVIKNTCAVFEKNNVHMSKSNEYDDELNIVLFATTGITNDDDDKDYDRVKALHTYFDTIKNNNTTTKISSSSSISTLNSLLSDLEEFIIGIQEINCDIEEMIESEKKDNNISVKSKKKQKSKKKKGKR